MGITGLGCIYKVISLSKNCFILFRLLVILLISASASAQFVVSPSNFIPVNHGNATQMRNPWTGGINAVHVSTFDINSSGNNQDLFIFDKAGNRILVFEAVMENGLRKFNFKPAMDASFPIARDWALMRDFDCNGQKDFFTYSTLGGSFSAYRNISSIGGPLQFELETDMILSLYEFTSSSFTSNIYVSTQDVPAIVDFDGDGDLDILTFSVGGTSLEFHENFSTDESGNCSLQSFKLRNRCYGQFSEASENNSIVLGNPCSFNVVNPKSGERHIGSTIFTLDGNSDGLQDVVLGDVTFGNLTFLENSHGVLGMDSMVSVSPNFPANIGNLAVDIDNFPAAFYEDVSGDGVKDLLATTNNNSFSENKQSVWYYKNTGTDNSPNFEFIQKDFLQDEMIDLGEYTSVAFFDYNGDGLDDMVIGSRGEFLGLELYKPVLALYVNIGTANEPYFQETDTDWLQIQLLDIGTYPHCTFGDLDGDGDTDLIVGDLSGRLNLFTNTAGLGNTANLELSGFVQADALTVDVGQQSTPQLFDLDGDGLLDLIVGERLGNLNFYKNIGSAQNPVFTLINENLGGVNTTEPEFFIGSSAPHFYTFAGQTYLLSGAESGRVFLYGNIEGNTSGTFELVSSEAFSVRAGNRSRPWVTDLNNDGVPDIFTGCIGGGVLYYEGQYIISASGNGVRNTKLKVYPNPADDDLLIQWLGLTAKTASYKIYDLGGRIVSQGAAHGTQINVAHLNSGVYILEIIEANYSGKCLWVKK